MAQMTLFEKIGRLFDALISSPLLVLICFMVALVFGYFMFEKEQSGKTKQNILLFYIILSVVVVMQYWDYISKMFEQLMRDILEVYYFPSLSVFFGLFILLNILGIRYYLKHGEKHKIEKSISIISCALSWILLMSFFTIAGTENVDIWNGTQMYTNETLLAILELFMSLFVFSGISIAVVSTYNNLSYDEVTETIEKTVPQAVPVVEEEKKVPFHMPKVAWKEALSAIFSKPTPSYRVEAESYGMKPVTNLYTAVEVQNDVKQEEATPVVQTYDTMPQLEPVTNVEVESAPEEQKTLATNEPNVVMQQGIPIIMNLEDYYTKDPLDDVKVDQQVTPKVAKEQSFIQKLVPVVEKKEEEIAVQMKPVISFQPKEEVAVQVETQEEPSYNVETPNYYNTPEPSLFDLMFQESSFHKNEEIVRLKQQYDAIDREIAAYENKRSQYKEVSE